METEIKDLLERGVVEVIDRAHLLERLSGKKKLRIKLGIDPTSPNIHIGRAVLLWKLRAFQELGHTAVFIVGDTTALVGDTSDKDSERPMLTERQVKLNMRNYLKQAFRILDKSRTEVHYNSEWLVKLGLLDLAKMANLFSLHEIESRELIAKRLREAKRVSLHEAMYPIMQGYDSVMVQADVELGGTDQKFNLLAGRRIQSYYKQEPQDIVMTTIMEGTDGRKMSSSWGNVINLTDDANDMFGKVMSISDSLIVKYFTLATRVAIHEIKEIEKELISANPRDIKIRLGKEIVTLYHSSKAADKAALEFEKVFTNKEKPTDIPEYTVQSINIIDALVEIKLAPSRSEARRLVEQGGVSVDDENAKPSTEVRSGNIIQVGKRKFAKIK